MRACPRCAEKIQEAATACRFCGSTVAPVAKQRSTAAAVAWLIGALAVAFGGLFGYRWYFSTENQVARAVRADLERQGMAVSMVQVTRVDATHLRAEAQGRVMGVFPMVKSCSVEDRGQSFAWTCD